MPGAPRSLRLLADDLTGALDSAAQFAAPLGPIRVVWREEAGDATASLARDVGTREMTRDEAAACMAAHAGDLAPAPERLSFFKLDSLLRGHAGHELAALLARLTFRRVIIAPAIPFQGRATRGGRQYAHSNGAWMMTGEDIAGTLRAAGYSVTLAMPGAPVPEGISLWDCEDEAGLARIAKAGLALGEPVLWAGAAGLSSALAAHIGAHPVATTLPPGPVLGMIGSDHPVMAAQLARVPQHRLAIREGDQEDARRVSALLANRGAGFVTADLPAGIGRQEAGARIETIFARLAGHLEAPGLLLASGGETLRALVGALGATGLHALAQYAPGIPLSRLEGGRWPGLPVISKSGAFGTSDFLATLLARIPHHHKAGTT